MSTQSHAVLAGINGQLTDAIAQHSVYAVFVLMALDALLPFGGELIVLYAGVVAAGAISAQHGISARSRARAPSARLGLGRRWSPAG